MNYPRSVTYFLIVCISLLLPSFFACDSLGSSSELDPGPAASPDCYPTNEPLYDRQWHLNNTGQDGAIAGIDVNIEPLWSAGYLGQNVRVAIIDDGVDLEHPDFDGQLIVDDSLTMDPLDGDSNPDAEDATDAHGNSVAGVAAAGANCVGTAGAAPLADIIPIRLIGNSGSDEQDAQAFAVASELGADVINNSWGPFDDEGRYPFGNTALGVLFSDLETGGRDGKGTVILWAAGNGDQPVSWDGYATHPSVIAIGAIDDQGERAFYSDYGPALMAAAPSNGGETNGIFTTDVLGCGGYQTGDLEGEDLYVQVYVYDGTGSYTLTLGSGAGSASEQNDSTNGTLAGAQTVNYNTDITGTGSSDGNSDIYLFTAPAGGVSISLDVPATGDFDLGVYCSGGNLIALSEASGAADENITLATPSDSAFEDGAYTDDFGGTSSATPLAAGVIASVISSYPDLTLDNIRWLLKTAGRTNGLKVGSFPFDANGHSEAFGFGMVDAMAMYNAAAEPGEYTGASRELGGYDADATKPGVKTLVGKASSLFIEGRSSIVFVQKISDNSLDKKLAQAAADRGLSGRGIEVSGGGAQALVTGKILVAAQEGVPPKKTRALLDKFGLGSVRHIHGRIYVGKVDGSIEAVLLKARELEQQPLVEAAGPDLVKVRR